MTKKTIKSLFCKLALLIRKKLACFGSDSKITVRCMQVLIRAVDVASVMKNSQEIVRASLLPFFSCAADDLTELINDFQLSRLADIKGTSQKPHANLDYIHMVLLPVLSSMFDHLGANQYGQDVLTGEIYRWNGPYNFVLLHPEKMPAHVLHLRRIASHP